MIDNSGYLYAGLWGDGVYRSISPIPVELTVVTPNGGEVWLIGTQQDIVWESQNISYVSIELSIDSGATCTVIVDSLVNTGIYTWTVSAPALSKNCLIRINDLNDVNVFDMSDSVFTIDQVTSLEDKNLPKTYALYLNYPNPFNPFTSISYSIPKTSLTKLIVYDILGREIKTLVNEEKLPGNYEIEFNASDLSSGIYFYRLQTGNFIETKKMVLMK